MKIRGIQDKFWLVISLFLFVLIVGFFLSFLVGRYPIAPKTVFDIVVSNFYETQHYWDQNIETVVMEIRLPRVLLAILVGGALSLSGASYQALFKNPMVSPDILGVSSGAGFGAAVAMLYRWQWWQIQAAALVFGLIAVGMACAIAYFYARQEITVLILAGLVTSSLFQALLAIVKTLADTDNVLPSITFWLMGGLGRASNSDVLLMLPASSISFALLFWFRNHIDVLSAGEDEARTMGINVPFVKSIVILCSTMMTVAAVSISGIIGWVGLIIPHIARLMVGAKYSRIASSSFLLGGVFLLLIDNSIRHSGGVELPLGVLCTLVGTPIFAFQLSQARRSWM
ncbi:MAG: iron ABC transporter permease [Synergistaceae bacterium]|jgi:iron complex transport system permease protein|nr:iron ABC transporter permease [Synergistaceae bacterium]